MIIDEIGLLRRLDRGYQEVELGTDRGLVEERIRSLYGKGCRTVVVLDTRKGVMFEGLPVPVDSIGYYMAGEKDTPLESSDLPRTHLYSDVGQVFVPKDCYNGNGHKKIVLEDEIVDD